MVSGQGESGAAVQREGDIHFAPGDPLTVLQGVGSRGAQRLAESIGIGTIHELLHCFPRRHREVSVVASPDDADLETLVRMSVQIDNTRSAWLPGRRSMVTVTVSSPDGTSIEVRFFNQPYLAKTFRVGSQRVVQGILDRRGKGFTLKQARFFDTDLAPAGPCVLDYPEIPGVSASRFQALIKQALDSVDLEDRAAWPDDEVPASLLRAVGTDLPDFATALRHMHRPSSVEQHERARRRFAVVEAAQLFRRVETARRGRLASRGFPVALDDALKQRIRDRIPFALTDDQSAALDRVFRALARPSPMGLLLQGDVGTGKTAVAVGAALAAIRAGLQVAFLAPTELLAEQHCAGIRGWLADSRVEVLLLTASLKPAARSEIDDTLRAGTPLIVFGTHALFAEQTTFGRLGLVIIDEQHRFGVEQRTSLVQKGGNPHVLYLTATPIPRTLTLTVFGDLDVAVLRQRPQGHRSVPGFYLPANAEGWRRIVASIRRRAARGQRVFVVCAKIGEDGSAGGVVKVHEQLARHLPCEVVHGRMATVERQATIEAFRRGDFPVLVGTTVLEVGVDVPEATLMVVIGCDRFGLATLHQLRGRVGRGQRRGSCILTGVDGPRVRAICRSTDGFELAEQDLALRGAGELLGKRQSGSFDLRALDPVADVDLLSSVREAVRLEPGVDS